MIDNETIRKIYESSESLRYRSKEELERDAEAAKKQIDEFSKKLVFKRKTVFRNYVLY